MPIYRYRYLNLHGLVLEGEVGARSLGEATREVRRRLKRRQEFVVWDRENPAPGFNPGQKKPRKKY